MKWIVRAVLASFFVCVSSYLIAGMPNKIIYQGRLTKSGISGAGAHTFTATLVTDAGNVPLGSFALTLPATGDFSLAIPLPPTPIDWVNGNPKLKISVDGEDLTPVGDFGVVPYALVAKQIENLNANDVHLSSTTLLSSWQHPLNRDKIDGSKVEGGAVNLTPSQVTGTALVSVASATQVVQPTSTVPALAIKGNGGSTSHTFEIYDSGTPGVNGSPTALQAFFDSNGNLVSNRGVTAVSSNLGTLSVSGGAAAGSLAVSNGATAGALQVSGNTTLATTSGNVGVGTASPSKKLDVVGGDVQVSGGGLLVSSTTLLATASGNVGVGTLAPAAKLDVVGGGLRVSGDALLATSSGKVGIGTSSPSERLEVAGGNLKVSGGIIASTLTLTGIVSAVNLNATGNQSVAGIVTAGSLTVAGTASVGSLASTGNLQVAGGSNLATSSGNVGIGTNSPAAKLDVNGPIKFTSQKTCQVHSTVWIYNILVPNSWTVSTCIALRDHQGAPYYTLGCIFSDSFSFGTTNGGIPSPNCGW